MTAWRLSGVDYIGGPSVQPRSAKGLTLVLSRQGMRLRRRRRRLLSLRWLALRGLDIRAVRDMQLLVWGVLPGRGTEGSSISLEVDRGVHRLYVREPPSTVRAQFATWVLGEEKAPRPEPPAGEHGQDGPRDVAEQALGIWRAAGLGRETLNSRSTLAYRLAVAEDHRHSGRLREAITLLENLAAQAAATYGDDDADTLRVHNALGQAYAATGRAEEAVDLLRATVDSAERAGGVDGADTLVFRNNLALAHQRAGQYVQAILLHRRNIAYTERRHGRHHMDVIARRNNLAGTAALCGFRELAITGYWEVLDSLVALDAVRGHDHQLASTARQNLAILHNPSWQP